MARKRIKKPNLARRDIRRKLGMVAPTINPKMGRPAIYGPELTQTIAERMKAGETLYKICQDDDMPHLSTVYDWIEKFPDFSEIIDKARILQAYTWVEQTLAIAENAEDVRKAELIIGTRKWIASKYNRKAFGDVKQVETKDLTLEQLVLGSMKTVETPTIIEGTAEEVTDERSE